MAAVPVALLDRPPAQQPVVEEAPEVDASPIGPNEFELIPNTDTLITACNCSASSDNPYQ
jgi:hypothetical protein